MELDTIIEKAQREGYNIKKGCKESSIQTKRGDVEVILNEGEGQAHCYIGKNQIQLFKDNKNLVDNLIHERDHFQIFPYDFISFGVFWGSILCYSMYELLQKKDFYDAISIGAMEFVVIGFHGMLGGINLIGDYIISLRKKMGINKKK